MISSNLLTVLGTLCFARQYVKLYWRTGQRDPPDVWSMPDSEGRNSVRVTLQFSVQRVSSEWLTEVSSQRFRWHGGNHALHGSDSSK